MSAKQTKLHFVYGHRAYHVDVMHAGLILGKRIKSRPGIVMTLSPAVPLPETLRFGKSCGAFPMNRREIEQRSVNMVGKSDVAHANIAAINIPDSEHLFNSTLVQTALDWLGPTNKPITYGFGPMGTKSRESETVFVFSGLVLRSGARFAAIAPLLSTQHVERELDQYDLLVEATLLIRKMTPCVRRSALEACGLKEAVLAEFRKEKQT